MYKRQLYGVLAGGHPGASKALEILRDELARTMQLCGADTLAAIDETMLRTISCLLYTSRCV